MNAFKVRFALLVLTLFVHATCETPVNACINIHGTSLEGHSVRGNAHATDFSRIDPVKVRGEWEAKLAYMRKLYSPEANYKIRVDYAAALIHTGKTKEAIAILEDVIKTNADDYIAVANLGTAYELDGQDAKALEFIRKGMELNKDSHDGSEWIHVKILEAKVSLAGDPGWLKKNTVLGLNFGSDRLPLRPGIPAKDYAGKEYDLHAVAQHITYQLNERLQFVSPPEPIVADLLFDLANIHAVVSTLEEAIPHYDMAVKFKPVNADFTTARRNAVSEVLENANRSRALRNYGLIGAGVLFVALTLTLWIRRGARIA